MVFSVATRSHRGLHSELGAIKDTMNNEQAAIIGAQLGYASLKNALGSALL